MAIYSVEKKNSGIWVVWGCDGQAELIVFDLLGHRLLRFILFFSPFLLVRPSSFVKW